MRMLTNSQIEQIQRATIDILENVGFSVVNNGILARARKAGAVIDETTHNIRIPSPLLRELLELVPSTYAISDISGNERVVGGDNQYCMALTADPWVIDYKTMKPRRPCLEDVRRHTIAAQKLEQIAAVSRMDFPVTDCEDSTSSLRALEMHLLNHSKHYFVYAASTESFRQWLELGQILSQGKEVSKSRLMTVAVAVVSPLTLTHINTELLLGACENNLPVIPTICPMAGTTSPYNPGSTLLLCNAENIFMAALTQLIKPGNPYLYMIGPSLSDMRTGHDLYYTIDKVLWKAAAPQLARTYSIPACSECGGSMTYRYDQQNGAEGMLFMLAAQSTGSNILSGVGSCFNANGMSAEMMVIQMEWLEAAKFISRGICTDMLQEGLESIKRVGISGNFLIDDFTIDMLRSGEFFRSDIFDFSGGYHEGSSLLEKAHEKVEEMVDGYKSPVPDKIQEDLRLYFENAYRIINK